MTTHNPYVDPSRGSIPSAMFDEHTELSSVVGTQVAWSAVAAGTVAALTVQLLLHTLGMAVGMGLASDYLHRVGPTTSFTVGSGIWWVLSGALSLGVGGWLAARLSGVRQRQHATLQGLMTWGLSSLLALVLMASVAALGGSTLQPDLNRLNAPTSDLGVTAGGDATTAAAAAAAAADARAARAIAAAWWSLAMLGVTAGAAAWAAQRAVFPMRTTDPMRQPMH